MIHKDLKRNWKYLLMEKLSILKTCSNAIHLSFKEKKLCCMIKIKKANVEAMKNKDAVARSIYSVVLNKLMLEVIKKREKGQEIDDADVSNILQKTIKELSEEKENYAKVGNNEEVEKNHNSNCHIRKVFAKNAFKRRNC